ncbi:amidase [Phytoactinopolyspora endophytica]|uniref:amidase n=1 Tax=Phytoactinopolyspora endophytica TaxID=1642495 RepID=UPI0013EC201A|nr:amidase [Phytoactinopolyspora endophytica]
MSDLPGRPVADLVELLRAGSLGAAELTVACLDAIEAEETTLRAWAHLDGDLALKRARELDALPAGERGPLHGIPVAVKDIIDTADQPTEYGSPIYAGYRPADDAEVVARLRAAGAVVIGKTVTTEFALFQAGPTTNPHDPSRTPGGSSSGSAAAVAAGTIPLALGTQTAGSIVRPASFCGVFGVKPTFAAVPTRGVKACAPSLDTVGVFARDVAGAEHALRVMADDAQPDVSEPPQRIRVGFARTHEWGLIPAESRSRIEQAVKRVATELDVVDVELPAPFAGLSEAQTHLMLVDVSRVFGYERARYADQLSLRLREVFAAGDRSTWAYEAARAHVRHCRELLDDVFTPVDVLLAPSVLGEAPLREQGTGDPLLCRAWTALGTPAVSVPGLAGPAGLPLGVQVLAPLGKDGVALTAARRIGALLARHA